MLKSNGLLEHIDRATIERLRLRVFSLTLAHFRRGRKSDGYLVVHCSERFLSDDKSSLEQPFRLGEVPLLEMQRSQVVERHGHSVMFGPKGPLSKH